MKNYIGFRAGRTLVEKTKVIILKVVYSPKLLEPTNSAGKYVTLHESQSSHL